MLQFKSKKYYTFRVCVCRLHAPYCHLWPSQLYNIFLDYLINGTIFVKKLLNIKCVLIFSTRFV